jgi:hypothetical protein
MASKSKLGVCDSCGGFLPANVSSTCVHCKAPVRSPFVNLRAVSAVAGVLGSGAMAFTLMACYGGACAEDDCFGRAYDRDDASAATDAGRDAFLPDVRVSDPTVDASRDADADSDGGDAGDAGDGGN